MKKSVKILVFISIFGAVILLAAQLLRGEKNSQNKALVKEKTLSVVMNERGFISPSNISLVQPETEGTILYLRKEGEKVSKGDVIAKIDAAGYDEKIAELELTLRAEELTLASNKRKLEITIQSEKNFLQDRQKKYEHAVLQEKYELSKPLPEELRQLEIELELNKLDLEESEENLKIQTNLFNKNFISKASLEPYERRYQTSIKKVEESKLNIELSKNGISQERRVELRQMVERRKAELDRSGKSMLRMVGEIEDQIKVSEQKFKELNHKLNSLSKKLKSSTCYALSDGYVQIKKYFAWRSGGQYSYYAAGVAVNERDVIAVVVDPGKMKVDLIFNEADFHKLKVDLPVEISIPAFPDKKFKGKLVSLGAIGKDRNLWLEDISGTSGVSMYNAEVEIEVADTLLRPGMSAMVEIMLEPPHNRLVIPRQAVELNNGKYFVFSKSQKIEIKGRYLNPFEFEIFEGLAAGDEVLMMNFESANE